MSYLQRDERRDLILRAAMQLALVEGLSALTARGVAQAASVSTGQVHHHFQSISHLRAAVFLALMQQLTEIESEIITQSHLARLRLALGAEDIQQTQAYLRLWNEAEVLMQQDLELKQAYKSNMQQWHALIVSVIEAGQQAQEFHIQAGQTIAAVAWRLIAFVCGLEGMYQLKLFCADAADFKQQTEIMIQLALFKHST